MISRKCTVSPKLDRPSLSFGQCGKCRFFQKNFFLAPKVFRLSVNMPANKSRPTPPLYDKHKTITLIKG